jgi:hypothetical protein
VRRAREARPCSLVLYDVSTLYFEAHEGDGFREPGFSKERRLEPQITIGLLTGQDGFPLMLSAFEGNRAETKTMLPVIEKFMAAHRLPDVTVVADAGMISDANMKDTEAAGLGMSLKIERKSEKPVRCSRLGLTCVNGAGLAGWPQVKRVPATRSGGCGSGSAVCRGGPGSRAGVVSGSSGGLSRRWRG